MKQVILFLAASLACMCSFTRLAALSPSQFSVGAYGTGAIPVGSYAQIARGAVGGGLVGEYRPDDAGALAFSIRAQGALVIPASDDIASYWTAAALAGVSYRIRLPAGFAFQPEIGYGLWFHGVKASGSLSAGFPNPTYLDQAIQASAAIRWSRGAIDIELAPTYTILPERNALLQLAGIRAGIVYRLTTGDHA
jgi:hypothetical protein